MTNLQQVIVGGLVSILVAVIMAVPGMLALRNQRKRNIADIAEKYEGMSMRAATRIEELSKKIDGLEEKIDVLEQDLELKEKQLAEWSRGIDQLIRQLTDHNIVPVWQPQPIHKKRRAE